MPRIGVASKNPVKANSIQLAYQKLFPDASLEMVLADIASGVSDQPMSDAETRQGAWNRLHRMREAAPECDVWAALEGGVQETDEGLVGLAWIVVATTTARGEARTATFPIPPRMAEMVRDGIELGIACDMLYEKENTKQHEGAIGLLSHNAIDRTEYYYHAAIMALLPLRNPDWYRA